MKILLDECLPKRFAGRIMGHEVWTVQQAKLSGFKNGELLKQAASQFDAFVTLDQNLPLQNNLAHQPLRILLLKARSSRFADLEPPVPALVRAIGTSNPGQVVLVELASR